ncbi:MAG: hypothetical protein V1816_13590 [Pseudomonadota bacterium]
MNAEAFLSLTIFCGLELSESRAQELHEYTRGLFAALKPSLKRDRAAAETDDRVSRVFGQTKSIEELDLDQVEPAVLFSPRPRTGD